MEKNLPTPDELGERLEKGEITEAEAIEIMSERARREAFANLFNPAAGLPGTAADEKAEKPPRRQGRQAAVLVAVVILLILLACLWT